MTTTKNNEHKKLNFSNEQEQSQACLNSAEHEKNQGRKVLNVPNLRFPEFKGEWKKCKLSEICTFFSGGTPSSSNKDFYGGNIAFIRSGELHADSTELFITQAGFDSSSAKMVEVGDLLLAMYGATSGDIAVSKIKGAINQAILCIRTKQNKKFIESVWNKHVSKNLRKYLQGGQGNLSADIVKGISFFFPTLKEQEKIANLVSLLDERIATQNKVINRLQSLIKGIANKSFHVARETKPLLEFAPNITSGNDKNGSGTIPLYGSTGIIGMVKNASQKGNIVLVARVGTIGTVQFVNEPCGVSDNALIIKAGDMTKYIYYFLKTYNFARITSGTTQPLITASSLKKIAVPIFDIERSSNIVRCLSGLEKKLNIEKRYLLDMVMIKQYLLRQMFI